MLVGDTAQHTQGRCSICSVAKSSLTRAAPRTAQAVSFLSIPLEHSYGPSCPHAPPFPLQQWIISCLSPHRSLLPVSRKREGKCSNYLRCGNTKLSPGTVFKEKEYSLWCLFHWYGPFSVLHHLPLVGAIPVVGSLPVAEAKEVNL